MAHAWVGVRLTAEEVFFLHHVMEGVLTVAEVISASSGAGTGAVATEAGTSNSAGLGTEGAGATGGAGDSSGGDHGSPAAAVLRLGVVDAEGAGAAWVPPAGRVRLLGTREVWGACVRLRPAFPAAMAAYTHLKAKVGARCLSCVSCLCLLGACGICPAR